MMQRNSTTLFLISPGATTPIPWVSNAPDFSGFQEPTLSILQQSWQNFLASGEPLEVITDPEPPEPEPDWQGFLSPFYSPAFGNSPFDIVETAVQTAWLHATDDPAKHGAMSLRTHWNNCIIGLTNPTVRSKKWLASSWSFLLTLLTQNGVALTEEQRQGIEALFKQYYLM